MNQTAGLEALPDVVPDVSAPLVPVLTTGTKPRRQLWIWLGIVAVLALAAVAVWKLHLYRPLWRHINAASLSVTVRAADGTTLANARIDVDAQTVYTNAAGQATLPLSAGSYAYAVSDDGYTQATDSVVLKRGDHSERSLSLAVAPAKVYAITGYVQDAITGLPVVNATVSLGSTTVLTDPSGGYTFPNQQIGDHSLAITRSGYQAKQVTATITNTNSITPTLTLVPNGHAVFVSNRENGRRGLFAADLDGNTVRRITPATPAGEDFAPVLSPDGLKIAFSSTRDDIHDAYGTPLAKLYVMNVDGSNLKKVGDSLASIHTPLWAPDSSSFYYKAYATVDQTILSHLDYSLANSTTLDLGEAANQVIYRPDGKALVFTVFVSNLATATAPASNTYRLRVLDLLNGARNTLVEKTSVIDSLALLANGANVAYDASVGGVRHRYSVPVIGGSESEILPTPALDTRSYVASPDGKKLVFVDLRDGKSDLYLVTKDGSNEQRLTTLGNVNPEFRPTFDPTGAYLTIGSKSTAETSVYVLGVAGGTPKKIADYTSDKS